MSSQRPRGQSNVSCGFGQFTSTTNLARTKRSNLRTDIRSKVVELLDQRNIQYSCLDLVRFSWVEENEATTRTRMTRATTKSHPDAFTAFDIWTIDRLLQADWWLFGFLSMQKYKQLSIWQTLWRVPFGLMTHSNRWMTEL
jgi:hypothetical protein